MEILEEIIVENFLKMGKEIITKVQETQSPKQEVRKNYSQCPYKKKGGGRPQFNSPQGADFFRNHQASLEADPFTFKPLEKPPALSDILSLAP